MLDIINDVGGLSYNYLVLVFGLSYIFVLIFIRAFLRRAFVNNYDPLHISIVLFFSPYLTGYLVSPFLFTGFSVSFFVILFFIFCFLLIIRLVGKPRKIDLRDGMRPEFQVTILMFCLAVLVLHFVFNMLIPGTIPLLQDEGVHIRFDSTKNSRLLTWLWFATSVIPSLVFAISENKRVIRFSIFVFSIQCLVMMLFASKGAALQVLFLLFFAIFVSKARGDFVRYGNLVRWLKYCFLATLCFVPMYFGAIGFSGDDTLLRLGVRMFGGFDQLIPAAAMDMAYWEPRSAIGADIISYQLMSFFKVVFSVDFDYDNIGQYIFFQSTGRMMESAHTLPNSNLILEAIFTSGYFVGFFIFSLQLAIFYLFRRRALQGKVSVIGFFLVASFVYKPVSFFMDGQPWVLNSVVLGGVVLFCWFLSEFLIAVSRNGSWLGKSRYRFVLNGCLRRKYG